MRHPTRWLVTLVIVAAILIGGVAVLVLSGGSSGRHSTDHPEYPYNAQTFPDQGNRHIPQGQVVNDYNSNPPTSGPHWSVQGLAPAPWGVSDAPVPKEAAVHNMEHGGVVVWYNCAGGPAPLNNDACAKLVALLAGVVAPAVAEGQFVLMTPYSGIETRIALTAWRTLDKFDEFDASRVNAFIASYECAAAPEAQLFCR